MTKIEVTILNRDREIIKKEVNPNQEHFTSGKCTYMIPLECVTLSSNVKGLNPTPELYYIKNHPLPINFKPREGIVTTSEGKRVKGTIDPNSWIVNRITLEMVLESTSKPKGELLKLIIGYLSDPSKILMLAFVGIIIGTIYGDQLMVFLRGLRV